MKKLLAPVLLAFLFVVGAMVGSSTADELEKGLQRDLIESKLAAAQAGATLRSGGVPSEDTARLKSIADRVRASQLLMEERFAMRVAQATALGERAAQRQDSVAAELRKALEEYLALIDAIPPDGTISPATLDALTTLLNKIVPQKNQPLLGTLPYRHLNYPAREPATTATFVPAYKGGNRSVSPADTAASAESPISAEITALAQSLQWNPVLIYEWVKNNVETEWYFGIMKGAEETLRQKSGNDADQAALLVSLLRASGFPSRFVKGTIEFFPGIDKVKNLTGIDDPLKIAAFFQKAGIPFKPVIAGGGISNFLVEHVWVESQIPYSNYRGAVMDDMGKSWLGLDTSIKPPGLVWNTPLEIPGFPFDSVRDDYLQAVQSSTPLEFVRTKAEEQLALNNSGKSWQDLLQTKSIVPDNLNIIPASLQFRQIAITGEYTELPADLRHKLTITATNNGSELFAISLDASRISNKRLTLKAEPETVEDQNTIDSFGGLDNTPSYLVRLRPVLTLDGERLVVAQDGLPMGADFTLNIDIVTPAGSERISSSQINGNLAVIGVVGQKAQAPAAITEKDDAEAILHKEAMGYIDRWNRAEDELAAFMGQRLSRPAVSIATVGGQIDVAYLLDTPHDFQWQGLFLDAGYRRIETIGKSGLEKEFMRLSSLQGSVLEHRIFEDDLKVDSVSTAKLLQLAQVDGIELISIDKTNIDTILPTLPFDDAVKQDVADAVNQGLTVTVPRSEISFRDWNGIGYVKEDEKTGEAGWILSGNLAGGMTAVSPDQWAEWYLAEVLGSPYSKNNKDPMSAKRIIKILAVDKQSFVVGRPTPQPLAVLVVDPTGLPVKGAKVTFRVVAGGGTFATGSSLVETVVTTGITGIARAPFTLGTKTEDNSIYMNGLSGANLTQVGLNLVTASVNGNYGTIRLPDHFQEFGWPDTPHHIEKVMGDGFAALANNPAGSVMARVADQYGNPVSNIPLMFQAQTPVSSNPVVSLPASARNIEFYQQEKCALAYPLYGECATVSAITLTTEYFGSMVNTILGNTVGTNYTVKVSAPPPLNLVPALFTLSSDGYRTNGDYIPPGLFISKLELVNDLKQPVSAAKAGKTLAAPLVSELFMLYDDYMLTQNSDGSWKLSWPGTVTVKPVKDGNITYTATAGGGSLTPTKNLGAGKYQTILTTGPAPAVNTIEAVGTAQVTVPQALLSPSIPNGTPVPGFSGRPAGYNQTSTIWTVTHYRPDQVVCSSSGCRLPEVFINLNTGQQAFFFSQDYDGWRVAGIPQKEIYTAYGVDIQLSIDTPVIPVTKGGYIKENKEFKYSILPEEYNALTADLDFYTIETSDVQTWMGTMDADKTQGLGSATLVSGSSFDISKNYLAQIVLNRGSAAEIQGTRIPFIFAYGALVPDYNHDRKIDEIDDARAERGDLYYFWINDDDGSGDTEGTGIPGSGNNGFTTKISGTRDIIDWFPVQLDIKELLNKLDPAQYTYALKHSAERLRFVYTELTPARSGDYLTNVPTAQALVSTATINDITNLDGLTSRTALAFNRLNVAFLQKIKAEGTGVILLEGIGQTTAPLMLEVYDSSNKKVFDANLSLSIDGVEQMFRHKNLIQAVAGLPFGGDGGVKDRLDEPKNFPDSESNEKSFVFLHGHRVKGNDARGWQAEMFKRLYWSGSKAKFWGVSWYVTSLDYYGSAISAFKTSEYLQQFLNWNVNGEITIAAHSLGNMVVSSALSDYNVTSQVKNYFLINAAVASEAFNGGTTKSDDMVHPDWDNYKEELWTSEWYKLFLNASPTDYRSKLTWRDRFGIRPSTTTYYNFFSSEEDVLAIHPHDDVPNIEDVYEMIKQGGLQSWALQEKFKGKFHLPLVTGSNYSGWEFNVEDYHEPISNPDFQRLNFLIANQIDPLQLRTKPFFKKGENDSELFNEFSGSNYAMQPEVRNRLLVEAIPARTLAVGRQAVGVFGPEGKFNFNMPTMFKSIWPPGYESWSHNYFIRIAYPYTFLLYNKFVEIGGLK